VTSQMPVSGQLSSSRPYGNWLFLLPARSQTQQALSGGERWDMWRQRIGLSGKLKTQFRLQPVRGKGRSHLNRLFRTQS
jgi:hypothetical protein